MVDALLEAGFTVVVISPRQIKSLRSRYGSAGNKDDRFDAYVLADTLRTDRPRLRPLTPDPRRGGAALGGTGPQGTPSRAMLWSCPTLSAPSGSSRRARRR